MASSTTQISQPSGSTQAIMEPHELITNFADQELNQVQRYKSFRWDNFLLTTFQRHQRLPTADREYRLFRFDGYFYQQVWQGYIPTKTIEGYYQVKLRGVIESPDGKSFIILGTEGLAMVLKGSKCSQLLHNAQFTGLGALHYSASTRKYYGVLSKQVSHQDRRRILTFAEVSLNFTESGDLPANEKDIRQVITRIVSFTESRIGNLKTSTFKLIAPNMLICDFPKHIRNTIIYISYINPDSGWKHFFKEKDTIVHTLHFDLERRIIRRLPSLSNSTLLSINPLDPREMLYHSISQGKHELSLLVGSETGIELELSVPVPSGIINAVSYSIFYQPTTNSLYYWCFTDQKLIVINSQMPPSAEFISSSIPNTLCYVGNKHICLRQKGFLDQLASSGGNLSMPVSRLIAGFLKNKYSTK